MQYILHKTSTRIWF